MRKAITYARCSTDKQEMSIEDQEKVIKKWAEQHDVEIVGEPFQDEGISGRRAESRKDFMRMLRYVEENSGNIDCCLVYDESRWGRFIDPDEAIYFKVCLKRHGVKVVFVTGMPDDGKLGVRLIQSVNNHMATDYAMKLSMDSFRGHKSWAEKGFWVGGSPPYGFNRALYDDDKKEKFVRILAEGESKANKTQHVGLVPNKEQAPYVLRMFQLKSHGTGVKGIVNIFNKEGVPTIGTFRGGKRFVSKGWSTSTICAILRNPAYKGTLIYNRRAEDNLHEQGKWKRRKP